MKILIINPFDKIPGENFRDQRYTFLYYELKNRGYDVTWVTADYHHWSHKARKKEIIPDKYKNDFKIIKTLHYKNNISLKRFFSHFLFSISCFLYLMKSKKRYDYVFTIAPSENLFLSTLYVTIKKSKLIIDVLDLWPDLFEQALPVHMRRVGSFLLRPLHWMSNFSYKRAFHITAVSKQYMNVALTRSKREDKENFSYHYLGGPKNDFKFNDNKSKKTLKCLFAGQFGHNYDIELILETALQLKNNKNESVLFYLAGDGLKMDKVKSFIKDNSLDNVKLLGWLDSKELIEVAIDCHVGLNTYKKAATQSIPTKIFDYMSLGLCVLNSLKGEASFLVNNELKGSNYEAENLDDFYENIINLQANLVEVINNGKSSQIIFLKKYSFDKIYHNMIREVLLIILFLTF